MFWFRFPLKGRTPTFIVFLTYLSKQTLLSIVFFCFLHFRCISVSTIHVSFLLRHPLPTNLVAFFQFCLFYFVSMIVVFTTNFHQHPFSKTNMLSFLFGFLLVVFGCFLLLFLSFLVSFLFCSQTLCGSVPSLFHRYLCFAVASSLLVFGLFVTALSLSPCDPPLPFQSNPPFDWAFVSYVSVHVVCVFFLVLSGFFSLVFGLSRTTRLAKS